jgi:hypothetical protein
MREFEGLPYDLEVHCLQNQVLDLEEKLLRLKPLNWAQDMPQQSSACLNVGNQQIFAEHKILVCFPSLQEKREKQVECTQKDAHGVPSINLFVSFSKLQERSVEKLRMLSLERDRKSFLFVNPGQVAQCICSSVECLQFGIPILESPPFFEVGMEQTAKEIPLFSVAHLFPWITR